MAKLTKKSKKKSQQTEDKINQFKLSPKKLRSYKKEKDSVKNNNSILSELISLSDKENISSKRESICSKFVDRFAKENLVCTRSQNKKTNVTELKRCTRSNVKRHLQNEIDEIFLKNNQTPNEEIKKKSTEIIKAVKQEYVKSKLYNINSIILAKQAYSIPWPAKVKKINLEKVCVYFFGDGRDGFVDKNEIYDFASSQKAVKSVLSRKKIPRGYKQGIEEVEKQLKVPYELSIFKND